MILITKYVYRTPNEGLWSRSAAVFGHGIHPRALLSPFFLDQLILVTSTVAALVKFFLFPLLFASKTMFLRHYLEGCCIISCRKWKTVSLGISNFRILGRRLFELAKGSCYGNPGLSHW